MDSNHSDSTQGEPDVMVYEKAAIPDNTYNPPAQGVKVEDPVIKTTVKTTVVEADPKASKWSSMLLYIIPVLRSSLLFLLLLVEKRCELEDELAREKLSNAKVEVVENDPKLSKLCQLHLLPFDLSVWEISVKL